MRKHLMSALVVGALALFFAESANAQFSIAAVSKVQKTNTDVRKIPVTLLIDAERDPVGTFYDEVPISGRMVIGGLFVSGEATGKFIYSNESTGQFQPERLFLIADDADTQTRWFAQITFTYGEAEFVNVSSGPIGQSGEDFYYSDPFDLRLNYH